MLGFQNAMLLLSRRTIHGGFGTASLLQVASSTQAPNKNILTMPSTPAAKSIRPRIGRLERTLKKWGILDLQKYRNMHLGYNVYEHVIGQVDYPFFFKHFNLPDTLFSWFLVTELHVWMIMVRYMADEQDGKVVRNNAVSAMWDDTKARIENLGQVKNSVKQKQIKEISYQFNAAIIGYDEGIQADDKTLAGALWRRFFHSECNNPEHVETLVHYVRKQICLFDSLPNNEVLRKPVLKLIDIKSLCKHQQ
ncbi:ubiquinol-cytochrome-c reductase complex assembly factor 1 isoform X2 [Monomorium pharaonis]|uniref:ubiquinol-cytochrome-c reductase complex assembly factor 1 isoform X2 n=1 Tax=Monomorium pharaonis TaxID=307658 RepID=UPI00102E1EE1|nr:ubiquinol-cytochrome-c reductase complex assembly factor 1 isoform X2 [Monomorium pharaonis]